MVTAVSPPAAQFPGPPVLIPYAIDEHAEASVRADGWDASRLRHELSRSLGIPVSAELAAHLHDIYRTR